jgi:signal peptide peptidase SppA
MSDANKSARRSNPVVVALAIIGTFTLVLILGAMGIAVWGMSQFSKAIHIGGSERMFQGDQNFIGLVRLDGAIDSEHMDHVLEKVDELAKMDSARAIFLEVNSPGGTVVASQELFDKLLEVRKSKPVLSYYRDVAASGAYYGSASSTWIVANRASMVGSIGVIMQNVILKDLFAWARLKPVTIKTGELKDAGSPMRDPSPQDEAYLGKLLKDTHAQFMDDVIRGRAAASRQDDLKLALEATKGRPSKKAKAKVDVPAGSNSESEATDESSKPREVTLREVGTATMDAMRDGRVVLGSEAEKLGLVDAVGSKRNAVEILRTALGDSTLEIDEIIDEENLESILQRYLQHVQTWTSEMLTESVTNAMQKAFQENTHPQSTSPLIAR